MTMLSKMLSAMAAALIVIGGATGAQGQTGGGGSPGVGVGSRGPMQIRGTVLCAECSLDEVRAAQSGKRHLYQFTHRRGQVVIQVSQVNNSRRANHFAWPPYIWMRAEDRLFQQLTAEANFAKEVELLGVLRNTRTLDLSRVTFGR